MTKLPPPPIHMKPGSPAFMEWFRGLADYIGRLASRPNFAMGRSIVPSSVCCIPLIETKVCQIDIEEREGDLLLISFYAGSWQDDYSTGDEYGYYLKLRRNGVVKKTLRGGFGKSGWDGDDRHVHGVYYHSSDADADARWTVTMVLDDVTGSYPTIDGAGLTVQVR